MNRKILITTGDVNGIGFEVAARALEQLGPQRGFSFVLWVSNETPAAHFRWALQQLKKSHLVELSTDLKAALALQTSHLQVLVSPLAPAVWVELSAAACLRGEAHALVTGPLSKPGIVAAGLKDLGHTEILRRLCRAIDADGSPMMGFFGSHFRVVLATGHRPLASVAEALTENVLQASLQRAEELRQLLPAKLRRKPIGVLGLNPHAGDGGLIGSFEQQVLQPLLARAKKQGLSVVGPLVPDVAFRPDQWSKISVYVALYHDQGLIPFKVIHGFEGVHITLGLPMIRTSVDHGTATDIFGKKVANPASMLEALQWALRLAQKKGRSHV